MNCSISGVYRREGCQKAIAISALSLGTIAIIAGIWQMVRPYLPNMPLMGFGLVGVGFMTTLVASVILVRLYCVSQLDRVERSLAQLENPISPLVPIKNENLPKKIEISPATESLPFFPSEIWQLIFSKMGVETILRLEGVSRSFYHTIQDPVLWKMLAKWEGLESHDPKFELVEEAKFKWGLKNGKIESLQVFQNPNKERLSRILCQNGNLFCGFAGFYTPVNILKYEDRKWKVGEIIKTDLATVTSFAYHENYLFIGCLSGIIIYDLKENTWEVLPAVGIINKLHYSEGYLFSASQHEVLEIRTKKDEKWVVEHRIFNQGKINCFTYMDDQLHVGFEHKVLKTFSKVNGKWEESNSFWFMDNGSIRSIISLNGKLAIGFPGSLLIGKVENGMWKTLNEFREIIDVTSLEYKNGMLFVKERKGVCVLAQQDGEFKILGKIGGEFNEIAYYKGKLITRRYKEIHIQGAKA